MQDYVWTCLITLLAIVVYFIASMGVGRARYTYKIAAPATTGHDAFERHFRVQMNTLEWMPIFLPSLWIFASYWGDALAAGIGAVWVVARVLYMNGYVRDAKSRGAGFALQALAALVLLIGALAGVVLQLVGTLG